jgi:hypothetical protein
MKQSVKKAINKLKKQKITVMCVGYKDFIKNERTLKQYINTKLDWYVMRQKLKSLNNLKKKYGNVYNINVLGKIRRNTKKAERKK